MTILHDLARRTVSSDPFNLSRDRVHEVEGPGRRSFALFQTLRHTGPVIWVLPAYETQRPMLWGLPRDLVDRLTLLTPTSEVDLLWCVEEALRAASVTLVIAEPQKTLSLTAGRRLQLAAQAGQTTGLMLIRNDQGSNATETRWRCESAPATAADSTLHHWELNKNKSGTFGFWTVNWNGATAAIHLVSQAGKRHQLEEPPR